MGLNRIHLLTNGHQFRKKKIFIDAVCYFPARQHSQSGPNLSKISYIRGQIRNGQLNFYYFFPGVRPLITSKSKKQTHALAFFSLISYSLCDMAAWQRYRSRGACLMSIVKALVIYHKVASSNTSRLETHPGFFRLLMKGISDAYVL